MGAQKYFLALVIFLLPFLIATEKLLGQNKGVTLNVSEPLITENDQGSTDMQHRTALVIGNAHYTRNALANPVNDARDLADVLTKCGFNVILETDIQKVNVDSILNCFEDSIAGKRGVNLFYYSGHGLQYDGENYFIPVDAGISQTSDIESEATKINKVLRKLAAAKGGLNIVILDACRNRPFGQLSADIKPGLSDMNEVPRNTSIFYATRPNYVALDGAGNNSPFTESLIKQINGDTLEFFQIIRKVTREVDHKTAGKQIPTVMGSPYEEFYFKQKDTKRKPELFIVSIGISQYEDHNHNLRYGKSSAFDFSAVMRAAGGQSTIYGNIHENILSNSEATTANILKLLASVKNEIREGDVLLFYYSGYVFQNKMAEPFCVPYDGDFENESAMNLKMDTLFSVITELPCRSLLFLDVIDAQKSDNIFFREDGVNTLIERMNNPVNNIAVIRSGQDGEHSWESVEWNGSLFIYGIGKALAVQAKSKQSDIRTFAGSLSTFVGELSKGEQNPRLYEPRGWLNFKLF